MSSSELTEARVARIREVASRRQHDLTVFMERVHKPHNVAAIIRTCDAVGIATTHAVPGDEGISRSNHIAQGAQRWVHLNRYDDTTAGLSALKAKGFKLYAAHFDETAVDFRDIDFTKPSAIVLGTEKFGVSDEALELCDQSIIIPMLGMTQSLNVSVATAVILYEAQRQRAQSGKYDNPDPRTTKLNETLADAWIKREIARRHRQPLPEIPNGGDDSDGGDGREAIELTEC